MCEGVLLQVQVASLGKRINIGFEQVIDRTTDFYKKYDLTFISVNGYH